MSALLERLKSALVHRYAVESEIGRGGMAVVFLAEDLKHKRQVAIKVLHPELAASVGAERFLREIETVAGLAHPHILPLHDSGEAGGLLFYVMPYLEGESLGERLQREGQLPLDEAVTIAREVADGLDYAHERGVVHRDIKPGNVLLSRGHALIADFGIAKAVGAAGEGDRSATATGITVGTPRYMSPEQATGVADVDGRSDVYALGCVLWEMLAGEPPFDGPTPHAILARKATETPPQVRALRPTVPAALENVVARALASSPADRFQTAGDFARALEAPETVGRLRRRRPRAGQSAFWTAAVVVIVVGTWAVATRRDPQPALPEIPLDAASIVVLPFQVIGADSASPARNYGVVAGDLFDMVVTEDYGRRIAHPGTVMQEWRRAGGTPTGALSEAAELAIARDLGAGALVRGTILEQEGLVVLAARLVDVATGETRVPRVRSEGSRDELASLFDEIIIQLLTGELGVLAPEGPRLADFDPQAIQAYVAGLRAPVFSNEKKQYFREALAHDPNLADAALWLYVDGEGDTAALRHAWEHRDRLSERGRAHLKVLAAGRIEGSYTTWADVIRGYEELAEAWPEWRTPRHELGEKLTQRGALASAPRWRERAREALEGFTGSSIALWNLSELAFMQGDTVRARALADTFAAKFAGTDDDFAPDAPQYQWRLAVLLADSAAALRALTEVPDSSWIPGFALADGRGIADADRVATSRAGDTYTIREHWEWTRGHDRQWREAWRLNPAGRRTLSRHTVQLFRGLLLRSPEDTMAVAALRRLERVAAGADGELSSPDDRTLARCWIALWRLEHGDTTDVRETVAHLERQSLPHRFASWAALLDVLITRHSGGDVVASLLRADSLIALAPLNGGTIWDGVLTAEVQNLILSRLLREYGQPERALAASRRRIYIAPWIMEYTSIPEYLREEARLAAEVGDTAGATEAYRHYFALRNVRPDHPAWAAQWDSMRVEYGELTGVDVP